MKKVFALIIVISILAGLFVKIKSQTEKKTLTLADKVTIAVTVADNDQARAKGYSGHPPIKYTEGLLFVFKKPGKYVFWMNEMLFNLDFIFIKDGQVVELVKNVKAPVNNQGEIEYVFSKKEFNQLLEVKEGFIDKYNIKVGDQIL
jgi:uncharacterized membrane protein (UPF0127 family)